MGAFGGFIQTNKGRNLQAKAEAGAQLKFTRMGIGDGQLSGQSIPSLTRLISEKKSLPISRIKTLMPAQAIIGAVLSNQDVTTGFYFREMGIFAQDPDEGEILYAYGNSGSGAEYIPAAGTEDIIEKTIDMIALFGQAQNVSAVIDQSLVYATPKDVEDAVKAAETPSGDAVGVVVGGNTEYAATLSPAPTALKKFMRLVVKVDVASTGSPTLNPNGLGAMALRKPNGNAASLKAGGVYTLVWDGSAFILQGEGGEVGTAIAADVLAPKTIGTEDGLVEGTIPTLIGIRNATGVGKWPDGGLAVYPEKGYQKGGAGDGEIKVSVAQLQTAEPALASGNIAGNATVFGVKGKSSVVDTADAVLDPQFLLTGQSGYDDGVKKAGQMPNRSAESIHMPGLETTVWPGDRFFIRPPRGFYDGASWVTAAVAGLTAANLRQGVNVAGLIGALVPGKRVMTGSSTSLGGSVPWFDSRSLMTHTSTLDITGVPFLPLIIIASPRANGGSNGSYYIDGSLRPHLSLDPSYAGWSTSLETFQSDQYWRTFFCNRGTATDDSIKGYIDVNAYRIAVPYGGMVYDWTVIEK